MILQNCKTHLFWATAIIFSLAFTKYYYLLTHEFHPPSFSENIADFNADKVFQKRFLIPVCANILSSNLGLHFDTTLKSISFIATLGLILGFSKLIMKISERQITPYWSLILFIPVTWNYMLLNSIYHSYDIPALAFYCIGLWLFLDKKYFIYYFVFFIGTFNRESTCLITLTAAIISINCDSSRDIKRFYLNNKILITHILIQALVWVLLTQYLKFLVKDNTGQLYEHTFSMLKFMSDAWQGNPSWPFLQTELFFGNPRSLITIFAGIWIFIPFLWKYIPMGAKRSLWLFPIYMIPAISYANLMESRVYHELNIILALVLVSGLSNYFSKGKLTT